MLNRLRFRNRVCRIMPFLADLNECRTIASSYGHWRRNGLPDPAPHAIKRALLMREARRIKADTFVETGTFTGDTVWFMRDGFRKIFSIEVQPELAAIASQRFENHPQVKIVQGDSAVVLSDILPEVGKTTLFWLDGHYSAGVTGRGNKDYPIYEELAAIAQRPPERFSIVIDDLRFFGNDDAYPTQEELLAHVHELFPRLDVHFELDMIWSCG